MQSNRARIAVGVAALAAIVALFVVLSGDDDESTSAPVAEETTAVDPGEGSGEEGGRREGPGQEPATPPRETIVVAGGEPRDGVNRLEYEQGDQVRLEVRSDVDEEIHVHGYDLYEQLTAGERTRFSFAAEIEGVFEIELHGSGAEIARLTVRP
jgi:hypothetical protein